MTKSPINRASALIASALVFSGLACQGQGTMQFTFEGQPPITSQKVTISITNAPAR